MVCLRVAIASSHRKAEELLRTFRFLMVGTHLEPGCLGCSAWMEPDWSVHYLEDWATEADMRRRVSSDRFTSILGVLESAQEPPQVQFDFITASRGLDYIAEVRAIGSGNGARDRGPIP